MWNIRKLAFIVFSVFTLLLLGACGLSGEKHEDAGESTTDAAGGIMLAGEESPEAAGVLKSSPSPEEVVITVDGQDVTYRLSEDAKRQIENDEVDFGSKVTFTTFSIGDDKQTIERFK